MKLSAVAHSGGVLDAPFWAFPPPGLTLPTLSLLLPGITAQTNVPKFSSQALLSEELQLRQKYCVILIREGASGSVPISEEDGRRHMF